MSRDGLRDLAGREGYRENPYKCTNGILTAGFGANLQQSSTARVFEAAGIYNFDDVKNGNAVLSHREWYTILLKHVNTFATELNTAFPGYNTLPSNVKDGMINVTYQLGITSLRKKESVVKALKNLIKKEGSKEDLVEAIMNMEVVYKEKKKKYGEIYKTRFGCIKNYILGK